MSEPLRALIIILGLAIPVFWIARAPMCEFATREADFRLRRNLWIGITVAFFTAHSFWLYAFVAALLLMYGSARDSNRLALFLALLVVVPPVPSKLPAFGLINYLITIDIVRLLCLIVLLPAFFALQARPHQARFGSLLADQCLIAYVVLQLILQGLVDTFTNTARASFMVCIDVLLPYYVASRAVRDMRTLRDALMAFTLAVVLVSLIAGFEYAKGWLLYGSVNAALGLHIDFGAYLLREEHLRVHASTGHALTLGYVVVVGLALFIFSGRCIANKNLRHLALAALLLGLWAPVSRGPWLGALLVLAIALATGQDVGKRAVTLCLWAVPVVGLLLITPYGAKIIDLLPFVGTVDEFNVTYRQRLLDISIEVIKMNPLLGSFTYLSLPEMQELIQGQGIIDVVNSYIGVALTFGLVGLTLYCGVFAAAVQAVWVSFRLHPRTSEMYHAGRALLAAMLAILFLIASVSGIGVVPIVYWTVAGLCIGYGQMARAAARARQSVAQPSRWMPSRQA